MLRRGTSLATPVARIFYADDRNLYGDGRESPHADEGPVPPGEPESKGEPTALHTLGEQIAFFTSTHHYGGGGLTAHKCYSRSANTDATPCVDGVLDVAHGGVLPIPVVTYAAGAARRRASAGKL